MTQIRGEPFWTPVDSHVSVLDIEQSGLRSRISPLGGDNLRSEGGTSFYDGSEDGMLRLSTGYSSVGKDLRSDY